MLFTANDRIEVLPDRRWVVVRTKPRCEKKLAEYCQRRAIHCYLPLRRSVRRYGKRVVEFMIPIFGGYVFAQPLAEQRQPLLESRYLAHVMDAEGPLEAVLVRELADIRILEEATLCGDLLVRPEVEAGRTVEIRSGPLAGLHGIVTRRKNKARLCVNVDMVGQSVSVEVDVDEVNLNLADGPTPAA